MPPFLKEPELKAKTTVGYRKEKEKCNNILRTSIDVFIDDRDRVKLLTSSPRIYGEDYIRRKLCIEIVVLECWKVF